MSVRELHRSVQQALGARAGQGTGPAAPAPSASGAGSDDEPWTLMSTLVRPEYRPVVEKALRLAEETLWRGAPVWMQTEALIQEFLGGHGLEVSEDDLRGPATPSKGAIPPEDLEKALEIESNGWDWLLPVEPVAAPELAEMGPEALDERLKALLEKRNGWDEAFGVLARGFVQRRLAAKLGFANLGQYSKERLGMSRRALEQRVWLEKRMEALPQLRHALEQGEVSYEKARLVAGVADFDSVNGWIRRAEGMTCVELTRAIAGAEHAQACARGRIELRMPREPARLLHAVLRALSGAIRETIEPDECLWLMARHFIETWEPLLRGRSTPSRRSREQNQGFCTTPGCSRPSAQDHHLVFRSHGGSDDPGNRTPVCAPHHLRGIHGGRLSVSGTAPDRLVWRLANGKPFTAGRRAPVRGAARAPATRTPPAPR